VAAVVVQASLADDMVKNYHNCTHTIHWHRLGNPLAGSWGNSAYQDVADVVGNAKGVDSHLRLAMRLKD